MRMSSQQNDKSSGHVRWRKQAHEEQEHMLIHMYIIMTAIIFLAFMAMLLSSTRFRL